MTEECIYMTIGYIVMFIMMIAAGKLYTKELDKNMKLELKYSDLLFKVLTDINLKEKIYDEKNKNS